MEALKAFGRASHYTLLARGQVVEVLSELDQRVRATMLMQLTCWILDRMLLSSMDHLVFSLLISTGLTL